jgi:hypothetical protein
MSQRNYSLARFFRLICFFVFGLLPYSSNTHAKNEPPVYDDPEGYSVLSLLLGGAAQDIHSQSINIGALSTVETPDGLTSLEKCVKIPSEFREAADDYLQKTKTPYRFQEKFALKTPYRLVTKSYKVNNDMKHPPRNDKEISDQISSGIFSLSPVGFDSSHTHAIARKNYICGSTCGWGSYHFLVKDKDTWEEAKGVGGCIWQY